MRRQDSPRGIRVVLDDTTWSKPSQIIENRHEHQERQMLLPGLRGAGGL